MTNNYPDKITKSIFNYSNLSVKLHIKLFNDKNEPIHVEYDYSNKHYLRLDNSAFITMDVMDQGEWDQSKSILITQYNIFSIIQMFKKIIDSIYSEDIFAVKQNGEIVLYSDMANKYTQQLTLLNTSSVLVAKPAIVYDDNDITYEGVNLFINKQDNMVSVPFQYFEALYYTLKQIDLFRYSQLILNYVITYYGNENKIFNKSPKRSQYNKNIVDFNKVDGGTSEANFRRSTGDILSFSGLDTFNT